MFLLHVSADFPDPLAPAKTPAIRNLLALAPEHEHRVYSLNRVGARHGVSMLGFGENHRAVAYGAPPYGLMLERRLDALADALLEDIARSGVKPDLVHAHKLSVDALVGERVAAALGTPLLVSSQGNSDVKIISAKSGLRGRWRRIWREAAVILPFAPWTLARLTELLGPRSGPTRLLPCPTPQDAIQPPRRADPVLRSAFHLAGRKLKNAEALIAAAARAGKDAPELRLEIAGGGDAQGFAELTDAARRVGADRVALVGPQPHERMPAFLNAAAGFAMPSRRESYGMVFAEALMAGTPALHARGNGIDGYLEDGVATLGVDAGSVDAIAEGMVRLVREQDAFKARLAALQESGALARFQRASIAETYRDALSLARAAA